MAKKMIAFYGAPGVGRTTMIAKLAQLFAKYEENVLLVLNDQLYCSLPLFTQSYSHRKSIGKLLSPTLNDYTKVTDQLILDQMQQTKLSRLGIYSYMTGELGDAYPTCTLHVADLFYDRIAGLEQIDYIFVDCATDIASSALSEIALSRADIVFRVDNTNFKSLEYAKLQEAYIKKKHSLFQPLIILNNIMQQEAKEAYKTRCAIKFEIEHNDQIFLQYLEGDLLTELSPFHKGNQKVMKVLQDIYHFVENTHTGYVDELNVEEGEEHVEEKDSD